jgi:hypothetical protein
MQKYYGKQRALNQLGWNTSLCCLSDKKPIIYHLPNGQSIPEGTLLRQKSIFAAVMAYLTDITSCELLYIRYPFSSPFLIHFLKAVKRQFPDIRIVMEFPTFPYSQEFYGVGKIKFLIDQYYAGYLHKFTDLAACTADIETVYRIPVCTFSHALPESPDSYSRAGGQQPSLQLLAAGNLYHWFGLDRLIKGMAEELRNTGNLDVYLHIAGTGPAETDLKKSVRLLGLESYVHFYGAMGEKELAALAAKSDLGVGVLGSFRKNLQQHKPLKHRSYLTYHLPFILSTKDPDFPAHLPFIHYFPEDDSPLHTDEIKLFYQKSKDTSLSMASHILQFTDWAHEMKKVTDKLKLFKHA